MIFFDKKVFLLSDFWISLESYFDWSPFQIFELNPIFIHHAIGKAFESIGKEEWFGLIFHMFELIVII